MIPKAMQRKALLSALSEVEDAKDLPAVQAAYEKHLRALVEEGAPKRQGPMNREQRRAMIRALTKRRATSGGRSTRRG